MKCYMNAVFRPSRTHYASRGYNYSAVIDTVLSAFSLLRGPSPSDE